MKLLVSRNVQFTRLVKADGRLHEFNFRKLLGLQDGIFSIDVADDRGNRIIFKVQKDNGIWKIIEDVPPVWVTEVELQLSELIDDTMNQEAYKYPYVNSSETN